MPTRKFFNKLARTLNDMDASPELIYAIGLILENENPRFNLPKFMEAAGYKRNDS